ncbi:MAG: MutS-related protein [bacterium]
MSDLFLDRDTRERVEWDYLLSLLEVRSPLGLQYKNRLKPYLPGEEKELKEELRRSQKFSQFISQNRDWLHQLSSNLQELKDLRNSLKKAKEGGRLSVTELFEIKRFLFILENLKGLMRNRELSWLARFRPKGAPALFRILNKGNQSPQSFYLVDEYSPQLKKLRREKLELRSKLEQEKSRIVEELRKMGLEHFHEGEITLQKETPEASKILSHPLFYLKSENLHSLVFAPRLSSEALKWSGRIKEIEVEEAKREKEVCQVLSRKVANFAESLEQDTERVAYLDFLLAKSEAALNYEGIMPQILKGEGKTSVSMSNGVHLPLALRLKEKGYRFHPLSIRLKEGAALLTGANMSGKTVLLKTVGLNVCLAQHGMLVPAKSFKLRPFDFVFFSTRGKEQDGLSAFGAEISGLKRALSLSKKRGLFLVDELARGTNPKEGFAINAAILKFLSDTKSTSLFTSHFDGLARVCRVEHWQMAGLGNISLDQVKLLVKGTSEDLILTLMEYRLEKVKKEQAVPHDALKIALLLGLDEVVIELAETFLKKV